MALVSDKANGVPPGMGPSALSHLFLDSAGQSEEWKKREADRRAGRGRKDWWNQSEPSVSQSKSRHDNGEWSES